MMKTATLSTMTTLTAQTRNKTMKHCRRREARAYGSGERSLAIRILLCFLLLSFLARPVGEQRTSGWGTTTNTNFPAKQKQLIEA